MNSRSLYLGGLLAGFFYLVGDIIGGIITPDYSYVSNAASELIQSGSPNRAILSAFFLLHALAIMLAGLAFAINFYRKQSKQLYFGGILLIIVGISHALSGTVFPMDPVGSEPTTFGIIHLGGIIQIGVFEEGGLSDIFRIRWTTEAPTDKFTEVLPVLGVDSFDFL